MTIGRNDRRVNRTRRMLREALMALVLEKGYETVTVEDITRRADIGRTTFYLHYKDKEALLMETVDTALNDMILQITSIPLSAWIQSPEAMEESKSPLLPISLIFQHAAENADLYRVIIRSERTVDAQVQIRNTIARAVQDFLSTRISQEQLTIKPIIPLDVFSSYFAGALLSILTWWLENDMPYSCDEISRMFQLLTFPGAGQVLGMSFMQPGTSEPGGQ